MSSPYVRRVDASTALLWEHANPLLRRLDIQLTERCNNNCIHCCINLPSGDQTARDRELGTDRIMAILGEAASLGCLTVRFTGGEPLLREDWEDLYIYARRLGMGVLLFTNATLITPHLADLFAHIPPRETIEVSVYGMKRDSYEAVSRVPGSYEAARRGIQLLLDRGVPFQVKAALLPSNKQEIDEFESWSATLPGMSQPPSYAMFFDLHCRGDKRKNDLIRRLRVTPEEGLQVKARHKATYVKDMQQFCSKFLGAPSERLFTCGAGLGSGCVDAYGHFQPCLLLTDANCCLDLKEGSLRDGLARFFPKIRETRATNAQYMARCARCFLRGLCEQCPAKSWLEHGTLDSPVEYLCEIAHTEARYLGLLGDGECAWDVIDWRARVKGMKVRDGHGTSGRESSVKPAA